jgi:hypothetical protein
MPRITDLDTGLQFPHLRLVSSAVEAANKRSKASHEPKCLDSAIPHIPLWLRDINGTDISCRYNIFPFKASLILSNLSLIDFQSIIDQFSIQSY